MDFPLDHPWKYDPHFVIYQLKGNKKPGPQDQESRPLEEKLANQHSWLEVKAIIETDANPAQALSAAVPPPQPKFTPAPVYYTFYRPAGEPVAKEEIKFTPLLEERRTECSKITLTGKRWDLGGG